MISNCERCALRCEPHVLQLAGRRRRALERSGHEVVCITKQGPEQSDDDPSSQPINCRTRHHMPDEAPVGRSSGSLHSYCFRVVQEPLLWISPEARCAAESRGPPPFGRPRARQPPFDPRTRSTSSSAHLPPPPASGQQRQKLSEKVRVHCPHPATTVSYILGLIHWS